jgi:hypothetical protein
MADRRPAQSDPAIPPPEKITLVSLWKALTVGQAWTIAAAAIAVLVGAASLGGWVQSGRGDREIANLDAKNHSLSEQIENLKRALDAAGEMARNSNVNTQVLEGEIEFLNRFVSYIRSPNEVSKTLFINMVCAMWREAETRRVHIDRAPLALSSTQIQAGLSPEIKALLISHGISPSDLYRAGQPPTRTVQPTVQRANPITAPKLNPIIEPDPDVQRAQSIVQKQANTISVTKTVTFPDGLRFEVPSEIAFAVHTKAECAPR